MADPAVRRALRLATDRQTLFDKVALGQGSLAESVVPQMTPDHIALSPAPYDPILATRLLDAAGWRLGADGIRHRKGIALAVDLAIPSGSASSATDAAIVADNWRSVGVAVNLRVWGKSLFFAPYSAGGVVQRGRFDATLLSLSIGPVYANINGAYDCASMPPRGNNIARYCNPDVDALNDRYVHSLDAQERRKAAAGFQRLINRDAPAIILDDEVLQDVFDSRLAGYHPNGFSSWGDPLQVDI